MDEKTILNCSTLPCSFECILIHIVSIVFEIDRYIQYILILYFLPGAEMV